jgi:hypothetical protein
MATKSHPLVAFDSSYSAHAAMCVSSVLPAENKLIWHIPFSARTLLAMYFKGPGAPRPFASVTATATLFQFSSVYTLGGLPGSAMAPEELVYTTLLTDILSYVSKHRQL